MPRTTIDHLIINSPYESVTGATTARRGPSSWWRAAGRRATWWRRAIPEPSTPPASSWRFRWSTRSARVSGLARGRLSRRYWYHEATARSLARPEGVWRAAFLLLL